MPLFCDYHTSSAFWYLQVLVGIGSRSMRIIKLKSLKLYAFGLCKEDINMTVRLVVNCNGLKVNTVREYCEHCLCAVGGRQVGAVHSKDLCRAFFDMYIGDVPVSLQAKEEVAENVAGLIRRC
ncbi:hypothetical protein BHE74_00000265 [Ensete ventricosum]|nr:hypothetical protein BHE74_00000265 [Ensete ventricosum]